MSKKQRVTKRRTPSAPSRPVAALSVSAHHFQGPIPPPDMLKQYDKIIPNGADRILTMAEKQGAHRIEMEKIIIHDAEKRANSGQIISAFVMIISIVGSLISGMLDKSGWVVLIAAVPALSVTIVFIIGHHKKSKNEVHTENA